MNQARPARRMPAESGGAREALLDAAERLLAENGIEGASLRQIAAEAGQANNSVIQYHFGDKTGLLREIILRRVAGFEPRRRTMLDAARDQGRLTDIRTLLAILFLPIAELTDAAGRHVYARFMMHFLNSFRYQVGTDHPGWDSDSAATRTAMLLAERLSFFNAEDLTARINWLGGMFFNALIERDNTAGKNDRRPEALFLADLFAMMTAAIAIPPVTEE